MFDYNLMNFENKYQDMAFRTGKVSVEEASKFTNYAQVKALRTGSSVEEALGYKIVIKDEFVPKPKFQTYEQFQEVFDKKVAKAEAEVPAEGVSAISSITDTPAAEVAGGVDPVNGDL